MKMNRYLCIVASVALLGTMLARIQDATRSSLSKNTQRFQDRTMLYARKTLAGPIARCLIYEREVDSSVYVEGMDSEGNPVIQCLFDKETDQLKTILCLAWEDTDLKNLALKNRRKAAAGWLKRLIPSEDGEWTWTRDGVATAGRYSSIWQSGGNQARLFIDNRNGHFIALRLEKATAIPGD